MKNKKLVWLTESAIMIALSSILSLIKLFDFPYGGSITLGCMVPMIIIAYRYGIGKGCITGLVNGIIQLFLGMSTLQYATSIYALIAIIVLDYLLAFGCTGFSSAFKKVFKDSPVSALISGGLLVCVIRYIFHVISGCTVWAGVSIPSSEGLIYSLAYNATYMIPETIVTLAILWYVSSMVDLNSADIRPAIKPSKAAKIKTIFSAISLLLIVAVIIFDAISVFGVLQNAETGDFNIVNIINAPWCQIAVVSVIGLAIAGILSVVKQIIVKKHTAE